VCVCVCLICFALTWLYVPCVCAVCICRVCVCVRVRVCVCLRVIRGEITINVTMSVDKDGILTVSIYSLFDYVFLAKDAECLKGSVQRRNVCTHIRTFLTFLQGRDHSTLLKPHQTPT
jgi:hypothetical protein